MLGLRLVWRELRAGYRLTWHLLPVSQGPELIQKAQGLHGFMNWPHNLLTVSWGRRPRALRCDERTTISIS